MRIVYFLTNCFSKKCFEESKIKTYCMLIDLITFSEAKLAILNFRIAKLNLKVYYTTNHLYTSSV